MIPGAEILGLMRARSWAAASPAWVLLVALVLVTGGAAARPLTCPFTGTSFDFVPDPDPDPRLYCKRLDLKPVGPSLAPPVLPVCPDDGFVMFKESFSRKEIASLRPWVESPAFARLAREETPYHRAALALDRLHAPAHERAWFHLQSTWEVEGDSDRYLRYVEQAIAALDRYLRSIDANTPPPMRPWRPDMADALAANLERRLGRFERARRRITRWASRRSASEEMEELLRWQGELLDARDSAPHYFPRDQEQDCRRVDRPRPTHGPQVPVRSDPATEGAAP